MPDAPFLRGKKTPLGKAETGWKNKKRARRWTFVARRPGMLGIHGTSPTQVRIFSHACENAPYSSKVYGGWATKNDTGMAAIPSVPPRQTLKGLRRNPKGFGSEP